MAYYVYLIVGIGSPFVKIGLTNDLKRRLRYLNTACPYALHLAVRFECLTRRNAFELETFLHHEFREKRRNGEWFEVDYREVVELVLGDERWRSVIVGCVVAERFIQQKAQPEFSYELPTPHKRQFNISRIGALTLAALWVFMYINGAIAVYGGEVTSPIALLLFSLISAITALSVSLALD